MTKFSLYREKKKPHLKSNHFLSNSHSLFGPPQYWLGNYKGKIFRLLIVSGFSGMKKGRGEGGTNTHVLSYLLRFNSQVGRNYTEVLSRKNPRVLP